MKSLLFEAFDFKKRGPIKHNLDPEILQKILNIHSSGPAAFHYTIKNGYVTPFGVVGSGLNIFEESLYKNPTVKLLPNQLSYIKKRVLGKVQKINGEVIVIHHTWFKNYYHWLIEMVPKLFYLKDRLKNLPVVMHQDLSSFHKQSLELLGFTDIIKVTEDKLIKADNVHFVSSFNHSIGLKDDGKYLIDLNLNFDVIKNMADWMRSQKGEERIERNIFVSRRKAMHRKILNERELISMLERYNYEIVYAEDYSFAEQIKLFSSVRNLCAVHGAGLANLIFMQEGSNLVNLIHKAHHEFCYQTLASASKVNYYHLCTEGPEKENPAYNDLIVDLVLLEDTLNRIK